MNFMCIFAAIGMLAFAGLCGVILAKLEEKIIGEREKDKNVRL